MLLCSRLRSQVVKLATLVGVKVEGFANGEALVLSGRNGESE